MYSVHVLYDGYSYEKDGTFYANCTCTLIKGEKNIIVDCMTAWDKEKVVEGLASHSLTPSMIDFVIATHCHSDHLGNLNLFLNAVHIVGFTISKRDQFFDHPFTKDQPYVISDDVTVVPTPGHTSDDVSVFVKVYQKDSGKKTTYVIAGDLFEKEEDVSNPSLWIEQSSNPEKQNKFRSLVALNADVIIPGHGAMFSVTPEVQQKITTFKTP